MKLDCLLGRMAKYPTNNDDADEYSCNSKLLDAAR